MENSVGMLPVLGGGLILLLLGGATGILVRHRDKAADYCTQLLAIGGCAAVAAAAAGVLRGAVIPDIFLWTVAGPLEFVLRADELAAYFMLLIAALGIVTGVYSLGYNREYYGRKSVGWLGSLTNLFLLSMLLVVLAGNAFTFLAAWETMSLVSFLLVLFEYERKDVRAAGYIYVVMTHLGTVFLTLSFLLLFLHTGSLSFAEFARGGAAMSPFTQNVVFVCCLIGFGTKAGLMPLNVWLPRAHPVAPSNISALMSAVMLKTALYGMCRVSLDFLGTGPLWWGGLLIVLGALSALGAVLLALSENDMKRFLAYSSSENMGVIFAALGATLLFKSAGYGSLAALALTGLLYHALSHALFKGLLFMGAGSVLFAAHTKNINELGGLIRRMPRTAAFWLIGGMSMASLPPLSGFISEWTILQSLLRMGFDLAVPPLKVLGFVAAAMLAFAGAIAAAAVVKHFGTAFLAAPRSERAAQARETPLPMQIGMGLTALLAVGCGLAPRGVVSLIDPLTGMYFSHTLPQGAVVTMAATAREQLAPAVAFAAAILCLAGVLTALLATVGRSRWSVGPTWSCGTPLDHTMEYNGTAYSHSLLRVFQRLVGLKRHDFINRRYEYYPRSIDMRLTVDMGIEKYLYRPLLAGTVMLSQRVKAIQNGNLQSYLACLVLALLAALLALR